MCETSRERFNIKLNLMKFQKLIELICSDGSYNHSTNSFGDTANVITNRNFQISIDAISIAPCVFNDVVRDIATVN